MYKRKDLVSPQHKEDSAAAKLLNEQSDLAGFAFPSMLRSLSERSRSPRTTASRMAKDQ